MVTSASVCLVHLFLLAAVKLSCLTDLKTTVQMWDGWKAIQSLEELNFIDFWFLVLKNFLLGCTLEDVFQILVCSKLLIPPECVCHACQRVNDHHVYTRSIPPNRGGGGWEHVKSKRFLFWCWHKNREIFTRTNYMMTFECGRGVNDQMCKQNSKRHDRHTFRTLCTPRKNVAKGKTHPQHMRKQWTIKSQRIATRRQATTINWKE